MKIAALHSMNNPNLLLNRKHEETIGSFHNYLLGETKEIPDTGISDVVSDDILGNSINQAQQLLQKLKVTDSGSGDYLALKSEVEYNTPFIEELNQKIENLIDQDLHLNLVHDVPKGLLIIALLKDAEEQSFNQDETYTLYTQLNQAFKEEFPSYQPPEIFSMKELYDALENMQIEDKAYLEGQLLIYTGDPQILKELQYFNELIDHLDVLPKPIALIESMNELIPEDGTKDHLRSILLSGDLKESKATLNKLFNEGSIVTPNVETQPILLTEKNLTAFHSDVFSNNETAVEQTYSIPLEKFVLKEGIAGGDSTKINLTSAKEEFSSRLVDILKDKIGKFSGGPNRIVIKLTPEHLGSITIKLTQIRGELNATIITSSQSAKELLDHGTNQLKMALPNMNIEIERFEVVIEEQPRHFKDDQDSKQHNKRDREPTDSSNEESQDTTFKETLQEAINVKA